MNKNNKNMPNWQHQDSQTKSQDHKFPNKRWSNHPSNKLNSKDESR